MRFMPTLDQARQVLEVQTQCQDKSVAQRFTYRRLVTLYLIGHPAQIARV